MNTKHIISEEIIENESDAVNTILHFAEYPDFELIDESNTLRFKNLSTENPLVELDGVFYEGTYIDSPCTNLYFEVQPSYTDSLAFDVTAGAYAALPGLEAYAAEAKKTEAKESFILEYSCKSDLEMPLQQCLLMK